MSYNGRHRRETALLDPDVLATFAAINVGALVVSHELHLTPAEGTALGVGAVLAKIGYRIYSNIQSAIQLQAVTQEYTTPALQPEMPPVASVPTEPAPAAHPSQV